MRNVRVVSERGPRGARRRPPARFFTAGRGELHDEPRTAGRSATGTVPRGAAHILHSYSSAVPQREVADDGEPDARSDLRVRRRVDAHEGRPNPTALRHRNPWPLV